MFEVNIRPGLKTTEFSAIKKYKLYTDTGLSPIAKSFICKRKFSLS